MRRRVIQISLGMAVSGVLVWLAFRDVDLSGVWDAVTRAHPAWLVAIAVVTIYSNWERARRWGRLVPTPEPIGSGPLFRATMIGLLANNVMPLRIGEAVRGAALTRSERVPLAQALGSVALERLFDLIVLLGMLAGTVAVVAVPASAGPLVTQASRGLSLLVAVAGVGLAVALFQRERVGRLMDRVLSPLPERFRDPLSRTGHALLDGFAVLRDPRRVLAVLLHSVWVWLLFALVFWMTLRALDLDPGGASGGVATLVTLTIVALFIMLPAAPGFVGTFQAGCVVALGIFGVSRELALGYSIVLHGVQYASVTLVGVWCLVREGATLGSLQQTGEAEAPPPPP